MFHKIAQPRTADTVIDQIESLVLDGVLRPGDRLPAERDMAGQFDVSRPVLRAALKVLQDNGLVVSRQGEGTFVAHIIGTVFQEPMAELIRRIPRATADYLEFRRDIEGLAAGYAAERATDADLAILDQLIADMDCAHATGDPGRESALDVSFHTAVIEAGHNNVFLHMMRSCYRLMAEGVIHNRARLYGRGEWRGQLLAQHRAIAAAIADRDRDAAVRAAQDHVDFVARALREVAQFDDRVTVSNLRLKHLQRVGFGG
ncbi:MAG: FadR/GntR family transcriptional regulator [Alphaproteobacteria bacterium]